MSDMRACATGGQSQRTANFLGGRRRVDIYVPTRAHGIQEARREFPGKHSQIVERACSPFRKRDFAGNRNVRVIARHVQRAVPTSSALPLRFPRAAAAVVSDFIGGPSINVRLISSREWTRPSLGRPSRIYGENFRPGRPNSLINREIDSELDSLDSRFGEERALIAC